MMIWQDRNMSKCFKVFYVKLYVHSLVDKLKWKLWIFLDSVELKKQNNTSVLFSQFSKETSGRNSEKIQQRIKSKNRTSSQEFI